jgi:MFS family permease
MFQTPNNSAVMGNAPQEYRGIASGTLATMRNIGMVLGVAVSGALFSIYQRKAVSSLAVLKISDLERKNEAFAYGLHITFLAAVIAVVIAMGASFMKGKEKIEIERKAAQK